MLKATAAAALALATLPAVAALENVDATTVNVDTITGLYWLDVDVFQTLSVLDVRNGVDNDAFALGWRYATTAEVNALFASTMPDLTTAPALNGSGQPFFGGDPSDYYAPVQADALGQLPALIDVLGGYTLQDVVGAPYDALQASFDRVVPCGDNCIDYQSYARLIVRNDGDVMAALDSAVVVEAPVTHVGHFLVHAAGAMPDIPSPTPNPIPEPETYALMLGGLAALALRRRRH